MTNTILNTIITFIISGMLGYCVSLIKQYREKIRNKEDNEKVQNIALLTLLQTNLTSVYFKYQSKKELPDYIHKNWMNLFGIYKRLGGNDYCDTLKKKMDAWEIIRTDILK